MRSASSPPPVGSTTISNSVVITSMQASIARLAVPRSARGTMLLKLRLQSNPTAAGFAHHASATANLTMPPDTAASIGVLQGRQGRAGCCGPFIYICHFDILLHWGERTLQSLLSLQCSFWRCNLLNL